MTDTQNPINPLEHKKLQLKVQSLLQTNNRLADVNSDYQAELNMLVEEVQRLQALVQELQEAQRVQGEDSDESTGE